MVLIRAKDVLDRHSGDTREEQAEEYAEKCAKTEHAVHHPVFSEGPDIIAWPKEFLVATILGPSDVSEPVD